MLLNLLRKRKEDAEILLTLGTPVPNCFGLIYISLFSVWTVNRAPKKLEGFFSARKKKEKKSQGQVEKASVMSASCLHYQMSGLIPPRKAFLM